MYIRLAPKGCRMNRMTEGSSHHFGSVPSWILWRRSLSTSHTYPKNHNQETTGLCLESDGGLLPRHQLPYTTDSTWGTSTNSQIYPDAQMKKAIGINHTPKNITHIYRRTIQELCTCKFAFLQSSRNCRHLSYWLFPPCVKIMPDWCTTL